MVLCAMIAEGTSRTSRTSRHWERLWVGRADESLHAHASWMTECHWIIHGCLWKFIINQPQNGNTKMHHTANPARYRTILNRQNRSTGNKSIEPCDWMRCSIDKIVSTRKISFLPAPTWRSEVIKRLIVSGTAKYETHVGQSLSPWGGAVVDKRLIRGLDLHAYFFSEEVPIVHPIECSCSPHLPPFRTYQWKNFSAGHCNLG